MNYNPPMQTPVSIPAPFFDDDDDKDRLRFKMQPREDFVRRTLDTLDQSEKNIRQLEKKETAKEEKWANDPKNFLIASRPISVLREEYRVDLPLNARYAALISAMAGLEWLVHSMHATRRDILANFAQYEADRQGGEGNAAAAQKFTEMREIIWQARTIRRGRVEETLQHMAEWANLQENHPALQTFADLCVVRNAIVHCGGAIMEFNNPKKLREAIRRLKGFSAVEEVEVDGEEFIMPLAQNLPEEQIWIGRDATRPPVEQTLDFIKEIHSARFS